MLVPQPVRHGEPAPATGDREPRHRASDIPRSQPGKITSTTCRRSDAPACRSRLRLVLLPGAARGRASPRGLGDGYSPARARCEGDERGKPGRERERDEADDRYDGIAHSMKWSRACASAREREHLHASLSRSRASTSAKRVLSRCRRCRRHQRGLLEVEERRQQRIGDRKRQIRAGRPSARRR